MISIFLGNFTKEDLALMRKIYIAGPDVFLKNAVEDLNNKKEFCQKNNFVGMIPFDANVDFTQSNKKIRKDIYEANIKMIQNTDIVIANMNNFRHNEQDAGTIFEIGYAVALNKEVYIYSDDNRTVIEKTTEVDKNFHIENGQYYDTQEMLIEGFDAKFNIMINESVEFINGTFEDVVKILKQNNV